MSNAITAYDITNFLWKVIAYSGGAAVIAYYIFRLLGKSWIENKFAEKLAQFKHQQALELQRLRIEIDAMLSGAIKLQDREFDILPKVWAKLDQAHSLVAWLVSPVQSYLDLNGLDGQELAEFFRASPELPDSKRQKIAQSQNKTETFIKIIFPIRLDKVRAAVSELRNEVALNGIFLPVELKNKLNVVIDLLWSAIDSKVAGVAEHDQKLQYRGWEKVKNDIEPLYTSIETDIQARLQSHSRKHN